MKHEGLETARRAARWVGTPLSPPQEELLASFAHWLIAEALPAGALGPREGERIWSRHVADSLTLGVPWRGRRPPEQLLDVGSGAGLPGIPLAILWPTVRVSLLDRAGRRVRLLRRAVRVLGLTNAEVEQADVREIREPKQGMVFRGSLAAGEAVGEAGRLLVPDGRAGLALSRRTEPSVALDDLERRAEGAGRRLETVSVPTEILDGPAWVLIIKARGD